jgi:membrane-bound lytic murein transglycosylase MltF
MLRKIISRIGLLVAIPLFVPVAMNIMEARAVESVLRFDEKWVGDFDGMAERNTIRALVPYSKTFYFLDGADQRGLTYEFLSQFEKSINEKLKRKTMRVHVIVIPTKRDRLLPDLADGHGDIAAGNLTITSERLKQVDFAAAMLTGIDEIIVTGPKSPQIQTRDDLVGKEIHVRASSSYYESLKRLNLDECRSDSHDCDR